MMKPRVAVIGAGLAGLSAAYYLRQKANVVVFERENRIGGRVLTSRNPVGEHGPQFVLRSEKDISRVANDLNLKRVPASEKWPGYYFRGRYVFGWQAAPKRAIKALLSPQSVRRMISLFEAVKARRWPKTKQSFDRWLTSTFREDEDLVRFVTMVVISETCCPPGCLTTQYALECLGSLFDDQWYRIRGGTSRLANALYRKAKPKLKLKAQVTKVTPIRTGARIASIANGKSKSEIFDAAIITCPQGECLIGERSQTRFHGYISILLRYGTRPKVNVVGLDLAHGLYTDGPLNYVYLVPGATRPQVLRILIPNAGRKLLWGKRKIINYCKRHLARIGVKGSTDGSSVQVWKFGLPCNGNGSEFRSVTNRVYLAGDRFGRWPSMDAAICSGRLSAEALTKEL